MPIHAARHDKSKQLKAMLDRLRKGPATTLDLFKITKSMCVSTRISKLRAQGFAIDCEHHYGNYWYTLIREG